MTPEKIMCSAIWVKDPNINYIHYPTNINYGLIVCGYRHHNCLEQISKMIDRQRMIEVGYTQGFLTNNNRFVDRVEAKTIAENSHQLLEKISKSNELYSEDVWLIHDKGELTCKY